MRRIVLSLGLNLLMFACSGGGVSTTTTVAQLTSPPTSTLTTSPPQLSSTITMPPATAPSTTTDAPEWPGVELLVTNANGVFYVDSTGAVSQLVKGRVAYAVDDTRGGLLFQVERGRSTVWASWQSVYGEHLKDTVVWWVPRGSAAAQALLVPTPDAGHDLVLYDAYQNDNDQLQVVYVRTDTQEGEAGFFQLTDSLRMFDADTNTVTELWEQGAWEQGFSWVSADAGLLAATQHEQIGTRCFFLDPAAASQPGYNPTSVQAWADIAGVPPADPACEECCQSRCVLSPNGQLLAYASCSEVDVIRLERADQQQQFEFSDIAGLDLTDTHLLVNQWDEVNRAAMLVDISTGSRVHVPILGSSRFVVTPVDILAPVIPPTPAAIHLGGDGLGVVDFGESVDSVMAVLTELLGPPDSDEIQNSAEIDRSVQWNDPFLHLQFTYWDYFDAAPDPPEPMPEGPVFHYYLVKSNLFATLTGITVGSTVGELKAAYPDVRFGKDCGGEPWSFFLDPPAGWLQIPIFGLLDGDVGDPATQIVYIGAGWDRAPC